MELNILIGIAVYLVAINLLGAALAAADKRRARCGRWRVAESTLLLVAALGGAPLMLVTMKRLHHKTRHRQFMWGLPAMILAQAALLVVAVYRFHPPGS